MKLRTKFAIVLLAVTLVLSGVVYGGLELYKDDVRAQSQTAVEETAGRAAEQIDAEVRSQLRYVSTVASRPAARERGSIGSYLGTIRNNSDFVVTQMIAANGTVLDVRGLPPAQREASVGADRSDAVYFQRGLEGPYVNDSEQLTGTDRHFTIFSANVMNGTDPAGVFVGVLYLNRNTTFRSVAPLETSSQHVTVRDGTTSLLAADTSFSQRIAATATVPSTGWAVTVSRDQARLNSRLRALALAQGGGLLVVLLSIVGLGYWEYSTNLTQTERLLDGFRALRGGSFDRTLSLSAGEEWEQISDGFNDLAAGLRAREAAIEEREQRLGVLNRVLRHNLQNDMNVIVSYAELLPDFADDPQVEMAAEKILDMGEGLITLGAKARQVERSVESAEQGRVEVDLARAVDGELADLRDEYPDVETDVSVPETAPVAAISTLEFAVANLCENAFEHNDGADPRVAVAVEEADDGVELTVRDNGPGIPDQELDALDAGEETPLVHGSGIGLWLSKWVVEKSGADLDFENAEAGGTVATVTFEPWAQSPEAAEEDENGDAGDGRGDDDSSAL